MPAIRNVPLLMLAGSMGWLKSTAISRLVAMPPLWGTTIDTVGPPAVETGEWATPPQLTRKATTRRVSENREILPIDIQLLPHAWTNPAGTHGLLEPRL